MKRSAASSANKRIRVLFAAGVLLFGAAVVTGLCLGSTRIGLPALIRALRQGTQSAEGRILLYVRLPRTAGCLLTGAALSVAGALIQNVFANRLASPSIIGVNAGAGLAVTLCAAVGIYGGWKLSAAAFLGAFLAVLLVSLGARKWGVSRGTVILMGVALNSLFNACADAVTTFLPDAGVMSGDFRVGDFSSVTVQKLVPAAAVILGVLAVLLTLTNELDVLTLGDENARGLGLDTRAMRMLFLLLAALLSGCAVSLAGLLSFVGLLVPHAVRRLGAAGSRHLLPLCALFGAGFVTLCDTVARTAFSPYEIPVGIIMAFLGAPFFVFILIRGKGGPARA
ncbi:MAG: iron ABC transporter permease [Clostridiales bacterium]|nr:iron ABC transporter permease [Clostridiales bacterium]